MKIPNTPSQLPRITTTFAFGIVAVLSSCTPYDAGQFASGVAAGAQRPAQPNYPPPKYAAPAPHPAPNPAPNPGGYTRMSGRLTVVKNDGTTGTGTWSGTADRAGKQTSLVWTIDGHSVNFRMTGGTTMDGTSDDGTVSVRAAFHTRSSGTFSTSDGESGTFTASN